MIVTVSHNGRHCGYVVYVEDFGPLQAGDGDWFDVLGIVRDFLSFAETEPIVVSESVDTAQGREINGALKWLAHDAGATFRVHASIIQLLSLGGLNVCDPDKRAHFLLNRFLETARA